MKNKYFWIAVAILMNFTLIACGDNDKNQLNNKYNSHMDKDSIVFGAGCFWCVEAIFANLKGVHSVTSGYCGGKTDNPTYREVCSGSTGHAEVAKIVYDPNEISFEELLEVFWKTHDPTTLNRQGDDVGTQYRSCIFYLNEDQKQKSIFYKKKLDKSGAFSAPIVTEILLLEEFFPAENYHQDYYENNKDNSYCKFVIQPKLEKFKKVFYNNLKPNE